MPTQFGLQSKPVALFAYWSFSAHHSPERPPI